MNAWLGTLEYRLHVFTSIPFAGYQKRERAWCREKSPHCCRYHGGISFNEVCVTWKVLKRTFPLERTPDAYGLSTEISTDANSRRGDLIEIWTILVERPLGATLGRPICHNPSSAVRLRSPIRERVQRILTGCSVAALPQMPVVIT